MTAADSVEFCYQNEIAKYKTLLSERRHVLSDLRRRAEDAASRLNLVRKLDSADQRHTTAKLSSPGEAGDFDLV